MMKNGAGHTLKQCTEAHHDKLLTYLSFVRAKELLESMRPFAAALQGHLLKLKYTGNEIEVVVRTYDGKHGG